MVTTETYLHFHSSKTQAKRDVMHEVIYKEGTYDVSQTN